MSKEIAIDGTIYDAKTGRILRVERSSNAQPGARASEVHARTQRSRTLQRRYLNKARTISDIKAHAKSTAIQAAPKPAVQVAEPPRPTIQKHRSVKRTPQPITHPDVVRFAKTIPQPPAPETPDVGPVKNAVVQAAEQKRQAAVAAQERTVLPSQVIKQQAIESATKQMKPRTERKEIAQPKKHSKLRQFISTASMALAVMLLGVYFTYLSMPALSTRIAAAQAGINASYPSYQPSGYSLNGPVAYSEGSVVMKFASNGSNENFTLAQTKSNWDSSAVFENYVKPNAGRDYSTATVNGLTIYTYNNDAAWVNGGILYTIKGNAQLAPSQIERLATSL